MRRKASLNHRLDGSFYWAQSPGIYFDHSRSQCSDRICEQWVFQKKLLVQASKSLHAQLQIVLALFAHVDVKPKLTVSRLGKDFADFFKLRYLVLCPLCTGEKTLLVRCIRAEGREDGMLTYEA